MLLNLELEKDMHHLPAGLGSNGVPGGVQAPGAFWASQNPEEHLVLLFQALLRKAVWFFATPCCLSEDMQAIVPMGRV